MKSIVLIPNNILSTPAKTVNNFDSRLQALIKDMKEALIATQNPKGVGLAAPQIGVPLRVFLARVNTNSKIRVYINPQISDLSDIGTDSQPKEVGRLEGCLSIPKIWGNVNRALSLTVEYQDESGAKQKENASGFLATIIQHETDHLNGILFTKRVLEQKGKIYQSTKDKDGKEKLEEFELI